MAKTRKNSLYVAGAIAALAAGILYWKGGAEPQRQEPTVGERAASREPAAPEPTPAPQVLAHTTTAEPPAGEARNDRSDYDPSIHPHPITPEHEKLYRENELVDASWQAMKKQDFEAARELARTHQREYPDQNADLAEGLLLLADCMEHPGPETRAKAQHFYDTKSYSQMRKRIRRHCLEKVPE